MCVHPICIDEAVPDIDGDNSSDGGYSQLSEAAAVVPEIGVVDGGHSQLSEADAVAESGGYSDLSDSEFQVSATQETVDHPSSVFLSETVDHLPWPGVVLSEIVDHPPGSGVVSSWKRRSAVGRPRGTFGTCGVGGDRARVRDALAIE